MCSLKTLLIICTILTACYCDSGKKKHKHKHHYELYWHGLHYLTFLFIKFKVIFVLGSIFTIGLFAGKLFAVFKFAEYMKKSHYVNHDEDNHEKVIYLNSHGGPTHDYSSSGFSQAGPAFGSGPYSDGGGPYSNSGGQYSNGGDSYPPGFSLDQPPPNAQISGSSGDFGGAGQSGGGQAYGPPHGYGRSSHIKSNTIYDYFKLFIGLIKRLNTTEMAFNDMNLKSDDCKRKFVCETDFNVNQSSVLRAAFEMFKDDSYVQYKTKKKIISFDECAVLYPNCIGTM